MAGQRGRRPHPNHHRATIVLWIHIIFAFVAADAPLESIIYYRIYYRIPYRIYYRIYYRDSLRNREYIGNP